MEHPENLKLVLSNNKIDEMLKIYTKITAKRKLVYKEKIEMTKHQDNITSATWNYLLSDREQCNICSLDRTLENDVSLQEQMDQKHAC